MLKMLMRIVASKGSESSAVLSRRLGVSHALVKNMLEELARQGYLKAVVDGCSAPCERCTLHTTCRFQRQTRIWTLTPKGESLVSNRKHAG
jgi:DeoR/GlpR family transcriptional regulator of sugar metabolism